MSKNFEFELKKNGVKLNMKNLNFRKIKLKFVGTYGSQKTVFNAKVCITLNPDNFKKLIKNISIDDIHIKKSIYDEYSSISNIYCLPVDQSSSTCTYDEEIYDEVMSFIKNIKFIIDNDKLTHMIFSLKNSNIKKIKLKGKLY